MFFTVQPIHLFFFIILLTGLLTVFTDIQKKKIYNVHLVLSAALGSIVLCYASVIKHEVILPHFVNSTMAFVIGWLLHRYNLWRGGDAKLFTLYAFLMPSMDHGNALFSNTIRLFASSFIMAMIMIMPVFIKDIVSNYEAISKNVAAKRCAIFQGALASIFYFWILSPFYYIAKITNPIILLIISYFGFMWGYGDQKEEPKKHYVINFLRKKRIELSVGITFGFLMRFWLVPNSLSWSNLTHSMLIIGMFVTISACIHAALNHLKEYRDRISFAPLLFAGCILSYTPFLTWIRYLTPR